MKMELKENNTYKYSNKIKKHKAIFYFLPLLIWIFNLCDKDGNKKDFIYIPDNTFLEALLAAGVDSDKDGFISKSEAESTEKLMVADRQISDLSGIGYFTNLKELVCNENLLTSIDVSKNVSLEILEMSRNQITNLNISNNTELKELWCHDNHISELNISNQKLLELLYCSGNQISELDVSQNSGLQYLFTGGNPLEALDVTNLKVLKQLNCSGNPLQTLNLSLNSALTAIYLFSMPDLSEVCVWTEPFPPEGVYVVTDGSPNVYFTTNCK